VRGAPKDQFGLDADERELRALLQWTFDGCSKDEALQMRYFSTPTSRFDRTLHDAPRRSYVAAPSTRPAYENRFTSTHVVYGERAGWSSYPPEKGDPQRTSSVVAVPLDAPADAVVMEAPHDVMRAERAGDHIVLTGYHDHRGVSVSVLDLRGPPRIADTAVLLGRYESEGRSHAFNSLIGEDGSGMVGLPTVLDETESGRWWWRSEQSDVSFLAVDAAARLAPAGELRMKPDAEHEDYECEVSCVDW
jgi:hypothetical protein